MNRFLKKVLQVGKVEVDNLFASSLSPCNRLLSLTNTSVFGTRVAITMNDLSRVKAIGKV